MAKGDFYSFEYTNLSATVFTVPAGAQYLVIGVSVFAPNNHYVAVGVQKSQGVLSMRVTAHATPAPIAPVLVDSGEQFRIFGISQSSRKGIVSVLQVK